MATLTSGENNIQYHTYSTNNKLVYNAGHIYMPTIVELGETFSICGHVYNLNFSSLMQSHDTKKFDEMIGFRRLQPIITQDYKITASGNGRRRKRRYVAVLALALVGMLFWTTYTAYDAKTMVLENQRELAATKLAIVSLQNDMNARITILEKKLNDALSDLDDSMCDTSRSLVHHIATQTLNSKFDRIIDTLLAGRLNTAILPLGSVNKLINSYPELQNSLYKTHPHLLYEMTDVEIISNDLLTSSVMRGVLKIPLLMQVYENVSMHFIFTNNSIFGPISMGTLSNKSIDNCSTASHNRGLIVCPAYLDDTHQLTRINDPVSIINGLVVVNHGILVQVDPGNEIHPYSPYKKRGPFILDRLTAKSVAYGTNKWYLEPKSFFITRDTISIDVKHHSIPFLNSELDYSKKILAQLDRDFKSNSTFMTPLDAMGGDFINEASVIKDDTIGFFESLSDHWNLIILVLVLMLTLVVISMISHYIIYIKRIFACFGCGCKSRPPLESTRVRFSSLQDNLDNIKNEIDQHGLDESLNIMRAHRNRRLSPLRKQDTPTKDNHYT